MTVQGTGEILEFSNFITIEAGTTACSTGRLANDTLIFFKVGIAPLVFFLQIRIVGIVAHYDARSSPISRFTFRWFVVFRSITDYHIFPALKQKVLQLFHSMLHSALKKLFSSFYLRNWVCIVGTENNFSVFQIVSISSAELLFNL